MRWICLAWCLVGVALAQSPPPVSGGPSRLRFEPAGSLSAGAKQYLGRAAGASLLIESDGFRLQPHGSGRPLQARFLGASQSATIRGDEPLPSRSHYLRGGDPATWRRNVPHYGRVRVEALYPGVDLVYYPAARGVEFDLTLEPAADLRLLRMRFSGIDELRIDNEGAVLLGTGGHTVRQLRPRVFQTRGGERREIAARYVLAGDREIAFELNEHDDSLPLLIDPVLEWATFLGGSGQDSVNAVAFDAQGFVYAAGFTASANFPASNAMDGELSGPLDGFVSKLSADGTELIWSTYFGGSLRDEIRGMRLDAAGNIYVSGATESPDFPTTAGAAQRTLGGSIDAFVSKLSPDGSSLVYSTLFGGGGVDNGRKLAVDAAGAAYVTGEVSGSEFPATPGAFQTRNGGGFDAFVAKINAAGSAVEWATYFGGNGTDLTFDLVAEPSGGVLLGGGTNSTDFPGTANAFQRTVAGLDDGFVARFGSDGAMDYFTYIGGSGTDQVRGLAPDGNGNVWIAGGTGSQDFPATANAPNRTFLGGSTDGFLARLPLPSRIVPGPPVTEPLVTYVGDEIQNFGLAIALGSGPQAAALTAGGARQAFGEIIFYSLSNFTPNPITRDGMMLLGSFGIIAEFGANGVAGSAITAPGADGSVLATDPSGTRAIVGGVGTPTAIPTPGTFQQSHGGGTGTTFADGYLLLSRSLQLPSGAVLQVEKNLLYPLTARVPGVPVGSDSFLGFEVNVTNVGTADAVGVVVSDLVSNLNIVFVSEADLVEADGTHAGTFPCESVAGDPSSVRCDVPVLLAGDRLSFFLSATPQGAGEVRNTAVATSVNANTASAEVVRQAADTQLRIDKELVEPQSGPVLSGTQVVHRLTVTNVGDVDAVDVELFDTPNYLVSGPPQPELNPAGVSCKIVQSESSAKELFPASMAFLGVSQCTRGLLSPGDSFSVLVTGTAVGFFFDSVWNRADVRALNAPETSTTSSTPIGDAPTDEEVRCGLQFQGGGDTAVVGANSLNAPLPPVDTTCWVRQQPNANTMPVQVSTDLGIDLSNRINPDGTLAGAAFVFTGPNGERIEIPLRAGPTPGTVETDRFDGGVRANTFSGALTGLSIDGTQLAGPRELRSQFRLNTGVNLEESTLAERQFRVAPGQEVFTAKFSEVKPDGSVEIQLIPTEGFHRAWRRYSSYPPTRVVTRISGLPPDATVDPMPECVFGLVRPIDLAIDEMLRRIAGADSNGMGGEPVKSCGTFTPQVVNGQVTEAWEIATLQNRGDDGRRSSLLIPYVFRKFNVQTPLMIQSGLGPYLPPGANPQDFPPPLYRAPEPVALSLTAPTPAFTPEGAVSAASNLTLSHGIGSIFGSDLAGETGLAGQLPLPQELNGVRVFATPVPGDEFSALTPRAKAAKPGRVEQIAGAFAPLLFVSPAQLNFQLPWEVDVSSGFIDLQVSRDGVASAPVRVAVGVFSPAVFSFDFGPGRAIAINPDGSVAHPADSFGGAVSSRPVRAGEALIILANGLGPTNPPPSTGFNSLDADGNFVRRDTIETPRVTIGGVEQQVLFSGMSPQFAGVYQLNILVTESTPAGGAQPLILEIGGARSREDVTVAVGP